MPCLSGLSGRRGIFVRTDMTEKVIVDEKTMQRTLQRLSHEIIEQNPGAETLYLVGIKRRGVPLAQRIGANIELFSDIRVSTGELDITWYRDDLRKRYGDPKINEARIGFDVTGKHIILVDDVLYTGRTARAAMEALIALGRPDRVQLLVMIDRGHRELPISANYVGKNIPTSQDEVVKVRVPEFDGKMEVVLLKRDVR